MVQQPFRADPGFSFVATKTYEHSVGLSACFRQHWAKSHCKFLHGYALQVKLAFEATELNDQNWVIGFGDLKPVKAWLEDTFDHKTLVAEDDPDLGIFQQLHTDGLIQLRVLPMVGCEGFAWSIFQYVDDWVRQQEVELVGDHPTNRVQLVSVEVREHGGNSAIYRSAV